MSRALVPKSALVLCLVAAVALASGVTAGDEDISPVIGRPSMDVGGDLNTPPSALRGRVGPNGRPLKQLIAKAKADSMIAAQNGQMSAKIEAVVTVTTFTDNTFDSTAQAALTKAVTSQLQLDEMDGVEIVSMSNDVRTVMQFTS